MGAVNMIEEQETAAVCPEPACDGGVVERRVETATQIQVHWAACPLCDGVGTVPIWKAAQWRAANPARRKISGVMRRGGF